MNWTILNGLKFGESNPGKVKMDDLKDAWKRMRNMCGKRHEWLEKFWSRSTKTARQVKEWKSELKIVRTNNKLAKNHDIHEKINRKKRDTIKNGITKNKV